MSLNRSALHGVIAVLPPLPDSASILLLLSFMLLGFSRYVQSDQTEQLSMDINSMHINIARQNCFYIIRGNSQCIYKYLKREFYEYLCS